MKLREKLGFSLRVSIEDGLLHGAARHSEFGKAEGKATQVPTYSVYQDKVLDVLLVISLLEFPL